MSAISKEDFKNDFTYLKLIGEGKCAQVHLVEDKNTGQKFAHKIIKISDVYQITSLFNEVEIITMLNDCSVPKVHYYFLDEEHSTRPNRLRFNMIIDYCHQNLSQQIKRKLKTKNCYTRQEIFKFMKSIVGTLSIMQSKDLLHRDIKPENILIRYGKSDSKQYMLCDFGFSVKKNRYTVSTITGTQDYVSPKVKRKFENHSLFIQAINPKDDTYSLGKCILQMIFLRNFHNKDIDERLMRKVKEYLGEKFGGVIEKMVEPDQALRWDFIMAEKQLKRLEVKKYPPVTINLDTEMTLEIDLMDEKKENQRYVKKQKGQSQCIESKCIQVQTDQFLSLQQQELHWRTTRNKPSNSGQTFYISLPKNEIPQKVKNLIKEKQFDLRQQVNCLYRLDKYILMGMENKVGVIDMTEPLNQVYILNLQFSRRALYQQFSVSNFILQDQTIGIFGVSNKFFYCQAQSFLNQIANLIAESKQKALKYSSSSFRKDIFNRECKQRQKLTRKFQNSLKDILTECFNEENHPISCCQVVTEQLFDHSNGNTVFGSQDGTISIFDQKYLIRDSQPITQIKFHNKDLIYSTRSGKMKRVIFKAKIDEKDTLAIRSMLCRNYQVQIFEFKSDSLIVHFKIIENESLQNNQQIIAQDEDEELKPFLELITNEGEVFVLNRKLQKFSSRKVSMQTINDCYQSFNGWKIRRQINSNQFVVNKVFNPNKQLYIVDSVGNLIDKSSYQRVYSTGVTNPSSLFVDDQIIVVSNYDGKVKILYSSAEIEKEREIKKGDQMISEVQFEKNRLQQAHYEEMSKMNENITTKKHTLRRIQMRAQTIKMEQEKKERRLMKIASAKGYVGQIKAR